jgi:TupA-like ATPgrasp
MKITITKPIAFKARRIIISSLRNVIVSLFGWKLWNRFRFYYNHGYILKLKKPDTFLEKLQWQKYYGNIEQCSKYIDKYEVREYVKSVIGEEYLVPLIGVYNRVEEIPLEKLPSSFVIKVTHGSGWNIIIKDKNATNWRDCINKLRKWLKTNYYNQTGEINYKNIKPRIIIEEYLNEPSGNLLDYKFWCFNGKFQFLGVHGDRHIEAKADLLDANWKLTLIRYTIIPKWDVIPSKPNNLSKMIQIAEKIAAIFPFVRVDLYCVNAKIFFGELTFTPNDGFNIRFPKELDLKYGALIPLQKHSDIRSC